LKEYHHNNINSLNTQSAKLDEFYILHRETGRTLSLFLAERKKWNLTYSLRAKHSWFIRQHTHENQKLILKFKILAYITCKILIGLKQTKALSLDLFDHSIYWVNRNLKTKKKWYYPYFMSKQMDLFYSTIFPIPIVFVIFHSSQIEHIEPQKNNTLVINGELITTAID